MVLQHPVKDLQESVALGGGPPNAAGLPALQQRAVECRQAIQAVAMPPGYPGSGMPPGYPGMPAAGIQAVDIRADTR